MSLKQQTTSETLFVYVILLLISRSLIYKQNIHGKKTHILSFTKIFNFLCPSSDDIWEVPPIPPNDLLLGHHNPPPQPEPEERTNPRQLLRSTQNRVADFWRSWMKYFAPNLLPRNKWFRVRDNIQTGDLVLELHPKHKRCECKMARTIGTYPGNDGLVRKVRIETRDVECDRPIHKLCLIATKEELDAALLYFRLLQQQWTLSWIFQS